MTSHRSYQALTQRHTQFDVDLVCGEDHRGVLVGSRRRREAGVGRRRIPWVTDGLDQVQLAIPLDLVAKPVHEHPCPRRLVQGGATEEGSRVSRVRLLTPGRRRRVRSGHLGVIPTSQKVVLHKDEFPKHGNMGRTTDYAQIRCVLKSKNNSSFSLSVSPDSSFLFSPISSLGEQATYSLRNPD